MTFEEITAAAASDPALKAKLVSSFKSDSLKLAETEGMIIRTKEQDTAYVSSQLEAQLPGRVDEKFNLKFKENLDSFDTMINELTGLTKGAHEKTSEFIKRGITEVKTKGGDPVTKEQLLAAQKTITENEAAHKAELQKRDQLDFSREVDYELNGELGAANLFIPPHLKTDEEKQAYVTQEKQLMKLGYNSSITAKKDAAGNIVYYKGDTMLVSTKDGKPLKPADILRAEFPAKFLQPGQTGSGTGGDGGSGGAGGSGIKNKEDIHKQLAASGVAVGTSEYLDKFSKIAEENKISV